LISDGELSPLGSRLVDGERSLGSQDVALQDVDLAAVFELPQQTRRLGRRIPPLHQAGSFEPELPIRLSHDKEVILQLPLQLMASNLHVDLGEHHDALVVTLPAAAQERLRIAQHEARIGLIGRKEIDRVGIAEPHFLGDLALPTNPVFAAKTAAILPVVIEIAARATRRQRVSYRVVEVVPLRLEEGAGIELGQLAIDFRLANLRFETDGLDVIRSC
jgi:hypothetical protein